MQNVEKQTISAVVKFVLAVMLAVNAPVVLSQVECNHLAAPVVQSGDISAADPNQVGRLFRTITNTTTCLRRGPAMTSGTAALDFDQYTYTNTTGGDICVFIDLDATGCGVATNQISMAAYLGSYNPASILTNLIAEPGGSTGQNFHTSMNFTVPAGATYVIVVHNVNAGTLCPSYTFRKYETNSCRNPGFDRADDGSADMALFRPSGPLATWYSQTLGGAATSTTQLGSAGDIPVAADYTGDETTEYAVFRPSNGTWYTSPDPTNNYGARRWGLAGDIPVQGDYDRDGIVDLAVFRPSNNHWYVLRSSTNSYHEFVFGNTGDKPAVADFDGDGKTDPALFRPSSGLWTILPSSGNYVSYNQVIYGLSTDLPVPADYDGDGKADIAVYRPSDGGWYMLRSSLTTGQSLFVRFGLAGDMPQPADYDGDRKSDQAVFRPSDGTWWINRSGGAGVFVTQFGQSGDIAASAPNIIQ